MPARNHADGDRGKMPLLRFLIERGSGFQPQFSGVGQAWGKRPYPGQYA